MTQKASAQQQTLSRETEKGKEKRMRLSTFIEKVALFFTFISTKDISKQQFNDVFSGSITSKLNFKINKMLK